MKPPHSQFIVLKITALSLLAVFFAFGTILSLRDGWDRTLPWYDSMRSRNEGAVLGVLFVMTVTGIVKIIRKSR